MKFLRNMLTFLVMMMLIGGVLAPQKAFCEEPETPENPLSQKMLETLPQNIPFLADKAISFGFNQKSPISCKVKEYADKALYALQHHMAPMNPSRTIEEFNSWMVAASEIFYMEAYFMHQHLCGAVQDSAKEKEFLKISCGIERDYLADKEGAAHICANLDGFETKSPTPSQENPVEKKGK